MDNLHFVLNATAKDTSSSSINEINLVISCNYLLLTQLLGYHPMNAGLLLAIIWSVI